MSEIRAERPEGPPTRNEMLTAFAVLERDAYRNSWRQANERLAQLTTMLARAEARLYRVVQYVIEEGSFTLVDLVSVAHGDDQPVEGDRCMYIVNGALCGFTESAHGENDHAFIGPDTLAEFLDVKRNEQTMIVMAETCARCGQEAALHLRNADPLRPDYHPFEARRDVVRTETA